MNKWAQKQKEHGFTIVELLIVVVVIAILAAITIVSYNGITEQSRRSQFLTGVNTYIKTLRAHEAANGDYPAVNGCLGANYPSNACWMAGSTPAMSVSSSLDAALAPFLSVKPTIETELMSIGVSNFTRGGLGYISNDSTFGHRLVWYFKGIDKDCGISGAVRVNEGGVVSQCNLSLD